jgi:hypothetical protein
MEIQYHDLKAAYIWAATSREVQFKYELLQIGVDFQEDWAFRTQGLTSWPRVNELLPEDLPK